MITIIKETMGEGAWWYKTPMDAYKDLQNNFGANDLTDRAEFLDTLEGESELFIGTLSIFIAHEGDQ